jgi:quercetin 2,3-dioxygenase
MNTILYPANERGTVHYDWLQAKHSFSFGQWHNPEKIHFGALRVLNDDIIMGGTGFPNHPHDNMEIITIPLQGALQHKDSTGGEGIINKNDVQIMSAGSGVEHSEFNASQTDEVNLLQLWIFAKEKNIMPRYDQKTFDPKLRNNEWQIIVSKEKSEDTLWINQDATLALSNLTANSKISYNCKEINSGVYLFIINGSIMVEDSTLNKRDAIGIYATNSFDIKAIEDAEILLIEVPMVFS